MSKPPYQEPTFLFTDQLAATLGLRLRYGHDLHAGGCTPILALAEAARAIDDRDLLLQRALHGGCARGDQLLERLERRIGRKSREVALRNGARLQVGTTSGRAVVNTCDSATKYNRVNAITGVPAGPDPRGCNNVEPWQTTLRGLGSYTIPRIDVLVSATVRSQP